MESLFFVLFTHAVTYMLIVFAAFCIVCAVYYLADLAEEYTLTTKKLLRYCTMLVCALYVCFWFSSDLKLLPCMVGTLSHGVYYRLLRTFPNVRISAASSILSIIAFAFNHYFWFKHFKTHRHSFRQVVAFFSCMVWLVPFIFLVSLTVNDSVLPGLDSHTEYSGQQEKKEQKAPSAYSVKKLISFFKYSRDNLPG